MTVDGPPAGLERILIVRLSSMGDIIHALPAAAMLREAFPHATLGWLIEERWAELLCALSTPAAIVTSCAKITCRIAFSCGLLLACFNTRALGCQIPITRAAAPISAVTRPRPRR